MKKLLTILLAFFALYFAGAEETAKDDTCKPSKKSDIFICKTEEGIYTGEVKNDIPNGKGTLQYFSDENMQIEGTFINGKVEGKGKIYLPTFTYEGGIADNKPSGVGVITSINNTITINGTFRGWTAISTIYIYSEEWSYVGTLDPIYGSTTTAPSSILDVSFNEGTFFETNIKKNGRNGNALIITKNHTKEVVFEEGKIVQVIKEYQKNISNSSEAKAEVAKEEVIANQPKEISKKVEPTK